VDKVGSVDPISDFRAMLARRDDREVVPKAIDGMIEIIKVCLFFFFFFFSLPLFFLFLHLTNLIVPIDPCSFQATVKSGFGEGAITKAVDCLVALRLGCVQMEEAAKFNDAFVQFKKDFEKKKEAFWKQVVDKGILPINSSEVKDSKFTPDLAKQFHSGSSIPSVSVSVSLPSASDDLFNEME
jgi:hypothetical protein